MFCLRHETIQDIGGNKNQVGFKEDSAFYFVSQQNGNHSLRNPRRNPAKSDDDPSSEEEAIATCRHGVVIYEQSGKKRENDIVTSKLQPIIRNLTSLNSWKQETKIHFEIKN